MASVKHLKIKLSLSEDKTVLLKRTNDTLKRKDIDKNRVGEC